MSDRQEFSAQSWRRAGGAFTDAANTFRSTGTAKLSGMDIGALGCNNGGTPADVAFSIVVPTLLQALQETVDGISDGLTIEGNGMQTTGRSLEALEAENTDVAGQA